MGQVRPCAARARTRWGRPFTPEALLWEDAGPFGPDDRSLSHLELVVRTGRESLAVDDFVVRQERQVEALRSALGARTREGAGRWILPARGSR